LWIRIYTGTGERGKKEFSEGLDAFPFLHKDISKKYITVLIFNNNKLEYFQLQIFAHKSYGLKPDTAKRRDPDTNSVTSGYKYCTSIS
jgi:hypothetical protein